MSTEFYLFYLSFLATLAFIIKFIQLVFDGTFKKLSRKLDKFFKPLDDIRLTEYQKSLNMSLSSIPYG